MSKRQKAEIDEDAIKQMMSGDIPRITNLPSQADAGLTVNMDEVPPKVAESERSPVEGNKERKKRQPKDYSAIFLKKREPAPKRQTYVNQGLYNKIAKILAVVANDLTVPTFIDNVLANHLDLYREEINTIYEDNIKKPL